MLFVLISHCLIEAFGVHRGASIIKGAWVVIESSSGEYSVEESVWYTIEMKSVV